MLFRFLIPQIDDDHNSWQSRVLETGVTGRVVVDVGVFEGFDFTVPAAKAGHTVYAFEPVPKKHPKIQKNVADAGQTYRTVAVNDCAAEKRCSIISRGTEAVTLIVAAAGAVTGIVQLAESPDIFAPGQPRDETGIYGVDDMLVLPNQTDAKYVMDVPQVRLDEVLDLDIWILKVDAQGFDGAVLRGAERLFAAERVSFVLFEMWPAPL
jgi:FkbM family methyltransferase